MSVLRDLEHRSILGFVRACSEHFTGRVLDLGCGKQPYRSIVEEAGGTYLPYDRADFPANVSGADVGEPATGVDAVLCTQVVQYVADVPDLLTEIRYRLRDEGVLVMTYPTHWPEVEPEDLWRFTRRGMEKLLRDALFTVERHEARARTPWGDPGEYLYLGYGVVARA